VLTVDKKFITELNAANGEDLRLVADSLIEEQSPARAWHPEKINLFLTKLKQQTRTNETPL
jgi:hypothetical protein